MPATTVAEATELCQKVAAKKEEWHKLGYKEKLEYLLKIRAVLEANVDTWAEACTASRNRNNDKNLENSAFAMIGGPVMTAGALTPLIATYEALAKTGAPPKPKTTRKVGDQVLVQTYPNNMADKILLPMEVNLWVKPGCEFGQGAVLKESEPRCTCVLSPGNFEAPVDILTKMFIENSVVVYSRHQNLEKSNSMIEVLMKSLVDDGYLGIVEPGIPMADAAVMSPATDCILMTGGCATYDAIVFGSKENKAAGKKRMSKPFDAELGAVSPFIVTPGDWTDAEVAKYALSLAMWKLTNGAAICASPQLLITDKSWPHREKFLELVEKYLASGEVPVFYNGTKERTEVAADAYADKPGLVRHTTCEKSLNPVFVKGLSEADVTSHPHSFRNEAFAPVLVELALETGNDAKAFLEKTRDLINTDAVQGSLSCSVIIKPSTEKALGQEYFDNWLKSVEYGTIGHNIWGGFGASLFESTWGAFPKHTPEDIQSGQGIICNALMINNVQKSVVRAPWMVPILPTGMPSANDTGLYRRVAYYHTSPSSWRLAMVVMAAVNKMIRG